MAIRVAMIGYGTVGSIHAARVAKELDVELTAVYGPNREKASAFASAHNINHISQIIAEAVSRADVAIVRSPSVFHSRQARECIEAGVHTLVELPSCEKVAEAEEQAVWLAHSGCE